ncbi:MAG: hypothetical protein SGILL_004511 [Bacillariaceae sp.]
MSSPRTPETACSSEPDRELYPKGRIGTKVQLFENMMSPKSELSYGKKHAKETLTSPRRNVSNDRSGDHETLTCSTLTHSEVNMEDHNSILASSQDDFSVRSLDYSLPNFNVFDVFGQEDDFSGEIKETDSEIQAVIDNIRKEASSMDAILLLDQVKSLESELEAVNKQFSARSTENEDLKSQLEEKDDKLARAELERDLHQADVSKLREDLKTCVGKMFDISMYESAFDGDASPKDNPRKSAHTKAPSTDSQVPTTCESPSQPDTMRIIGLAPKQRKVANKLPTLTDPSLLTFHSKEKWIDDSDSAHLLPLNDSVEALRDQDVFRHRNRSLFRRQSSMPSRRKRLETQGSKRGLNNERNRVLSNRRSLSLDRKTYHPPSNELMGNDDGETKRCGMFKWRVKHIACSKESNVMMMKNQIEQLQEMMKSSLAGSEKLRKRIATISRYYEGVISTLQEQVSQVKADKAENDTDLRNELCTADLVIRKKDKEIARLKALLFDQAEV